MKRSAASLLAEAVPYLPFALRKEIYDYLDKSPYECRNPYCECVAEGVPCRNEQQGIGVQKD